MSKLVYGKNGQVYFRTEEEKRIAIEAGSRMSLGEFVGLKGKYITMDSYGASAPADELFKRYGFTVDNVVKMINKL